MPFAKWVATKLTRRLIKEAPLRLPGPPSNSPEGRGKVRKQAKPSYYKPLHPPSGSPEGEGRVRNMAPSGSSEGEGKSFGWWAFDLRL